MLLGRRSRNAVRAVFLLPAASALAALGCGSNVESVAQTTQPGASSTSTGPTGGQGPTGGAPIGGEGPAGGGLGGGAGGAPTTAPSGGTGGVGPTCAADEKLCGSTCVLLDDPATGCAAEDCAPCVLDHATASCSAGACSITACDVDFEDCDQDPLTGCEASLTSVTDCGACGALCSYPNAVASCASGTCMFVACKAAFDDCDGDKSNGCEANIGADPENCGACGTVCSCNVCTVGLCLGSCCSPGLGNCDGNDGNGCETDLATVLNCGACGQPCSLAHAGESCPGGVCTLGACDLGWANCDGDPANGCETNLDTLSNCGSCGVACSYPNATVSCATGSCDFIGCDAGFGDCDGDPTNGCEVNTTSHPENCGACGTVCSCNQCTGGACIGVCCSPGLGNCDGNDGNGCEADLATVLNCGGCGQVCAMPNASETCPGGLCTLGTCDAGFGNCDGNASNGCETALTTLSNCGTCGTPCDLANAAEACTSGTCTITSCEGGFLDCDGTPSNGCETDGKNDVSNCGGCNVKCLAGQTCTAGACVGPATPPSCIGGGSGAGATDCGPGSNGDCCASPVVTGGTFSRSYDGVTFTDASYVAAVSDFRLDAYEITVGRFRKFVETGKGTQANPPASGDGAHSLIPGSGWNTAWNAELTADSLAIKAALKCYSYPTWTDAPSSNEKRPQNCMTWHEAFAFCAWDGGRLPTEAEWNYAAAGGSEQRVYPWSSPPTSTTIDGSYAAYDCMGDGTAAGSCAATDILAVGSKSPKGDGKFGQADLAGNIWEYVLDSYVAPYGIVPCNNCADLSSAPGGNRGGGYFHSSSYQLTSFRGYPSGTGRYNEVGVRCARSP